MAHEAGEVTEPENPKPKRLFFALWPTQKERKLLQQQVNPVLKEQAGRKVPLSNWHITLAFLGTQTQQQQACAEEVAASISAKGFELELQQLGYWAKPKVAWLAPVVIPSELQQLAADLHSALQVCGYQSQHEEYRPHLSLLRKARGKPEQAMLDKPVLLHCDRFALVESVSLPGGVTYQVINEWLLQSA